MKKKYAAIGCCIILLVPIVALFLWMNLYIKPMTRMTAQYSYSIGCVLSMLWDYGEANGGRLPETQQELIDHGYLRERKQGDQSVWEYREGSQPWIEIPEFAGITVNYGLQMSNVRVTKETLRRRVTGEEVFFFRGPPDELLDETCRQCSVRLYQMLLKQLKDGG